MAAPAKAPITCHILDTTTGRPAAGIAVTLTCTGHSTATFSNTTNSDGRIMNWSGTSSEDDIAEISALIKQQADATGTSIWKLQFDTEHYYGAGKTFFPVVELSFNVREGEHFHVPLLLGPYSFTTYRGS